MGGPTTALVRQEMTLSVDDSILIRRAAAEVFAYVSDYARDPTWRTGVSEMLHDPPGQIHLGAKTRERLTFAGMRTGLRCRAGPRSTRCATTWTCRALQCPPLLPGAHGSRAPAPRRPTNSSPVLPTDDRVRRPRVRPFARCWTPSGTSPRSSSTSARGTAATAICASPSPSAGASYRSPSSTSISRPKRSARRCRDPEVELPPGVVRPDDADVHPSLGPAGVGREDAVGPEDFRGREHEGVKQARDRPWRARNAAAARAMSRVAGSTAAGSAVVGLDAVVPGVSPGTVLAATPPSPACRVTAVTAAANPPRHELWPAPRGTGHRQPRWRRRGARGIYSAGGSGASRVISPV